MRRGVFLFECWHFASQAFKSTNLGHIIGRHVRTLYTPWRIPPLGSSNSLQHLSGGGGGGQTERIAGVVGRTPMKFTPQTTRSAPNRASAGNALTQSVTHVMARYAVWLLVYLYPWLSWIFLRVLLWISQHLAYHIIWYGHILKV